LVFFSFSWEGWDMVTQRLVFVGFFSFNLIVFYVTYFAVVLFMFELNPDSAARWSCCGSQLRESNIGTMVE
jgi:hypothetical protein